MNIRSFKKYLLQEGLVEQVALERELPVILEYLTGQTWSEQILFDEDLSSEVQGKAGKIFERRKSGEPLAYILGRQWFFKSNFLVGPGVLIPRPDTERLVEAAMAWIKDREESQICILEMGAGSGAIGLSLALEFPQHRFDLIEKSPKAFVICQKNREVLCPQARVNLWQGCIEDWFLLWQGRAYEPYHMVLGNPPYLDPSDDRIDMSVRRFEPEEALFSEDQGRSHIELWTHLAFSMLRAGGVWLCEIGSDQGEWAQRCSRKVGFSQVELRRDYGQNDRVLVAVK